MPPLKNRSRIQILKTILGVGLPGMSYLDTFREVERDYYNPKVEKGITSGNKQMDFLYKNQWLFKVPIIKDKIKEVAEKYARASKGSPIISDNKYKEFYEDEYGGDVEYRGSTGTIDLIDLYFKPEENSLPKSLYKPTSDYLEFLPSYSIKKDFNTMADNLVGYNMPGYKRPFWKDHLVNKMIRKIIAIQIPEIEQGGRNWVEFEKALNNRKSEIDSTYKDFLKNKKPLYLGSETSGIDLDLGVDLGHHKIGMAWDEDVNLPYTSISDAWDFSPDNYTTVWSGGQQKKGEDITKIQSTLLHKAGTPFKIYDRFYFDPETRKYISDEEIKNLKLNKPTTSVASKKK